MRRVFVGFFLSFATITASARANGDHLEPEPSLFTGIRSFDYDTKLLAALREWPLGQAVFWPGGRIAAFVQPTFDVDYRVSVTVKDGIYKISSVSPEIPIGAFIALRRMKASVESRSGQDLAKVRKRIAQLEAILPKSVRDVPVHSCERNIQSGLATAIFQVWETMLKQTRYTDDDHKGGTDGIQYHFTMHSDSHLRGMGGQIWSPPSESNTGRLAAITHAMREYCLEGGNTLLKQLEKQVTALSARLEKEQPQ